jgi:NAD(P)-dependent dehydrogenase (short-subunit alcohol dehydrogenase family)
MDLKLTDKVALITGSSRGIGLDDQAVQHCGALSAAVGTRE